MTVARERDTLPRCRCQRYGQVWDRCNARTSSPDNWLCGLCEEAHRPGRPDSQFVVVPLSCGP